MNTWNGKTTVGMLPAQAARQWPEREALCFKGKRWTFKELDQEIDLVAKGLIAMGVQSGEKVCVWLNNSPELVFLLFALARIGAIQVPINTRFRTADLEYVLRQADCATLISDEISGPIDYLSMVHELLPELPAATTREINSVAFPSLRRVLLNSKGVSPGCYSWSDLETLAHGVSDAAAERRAASVALTDIFLIMYTSGTMGFPKGVMRNHWQLLDHHTDRIAALDIGIDDVMLNYLPLFHVFGYVDGPITSMLCGNRQVLTERFDPQESLDLIESEKVTTLGGFEAHLNDLSDKQERSPRKLSSLRVGLFATGTKSAVPALVRARRILAPMNTVTVYGTTEIGANVTLSRLDSTEEQATETSGIPSKDYAIRIVDPTTGKDLPVGEPGEIIVKSSKVMLGYYNKPEETAKAFNAQGWFRTGDMGYLRADGYLRFIGRYKDMLKIGGENVDPMEVEGYLLSHPCLHHVAVVGRPDSRLSEVAVAFVVPKQSSAIQEADIIDYCRGRIASFKIPRRVWILPELPMTANGKVRKEILRRMALEVQDTCCDERTAR